MLPWLTFMHSKQGLRRQSNSRVLNRVNCRGSPWNQAYNANWVSNFRFVSHRHFLSQKISCQAYVCLWLFQAYLFWYASEIALCQNLCQGSVGCCELFGRDCLSVESDQSLYGSHWFLLLSVKDKLEWSYLRSEDYRCTIFPSEYINHWSEFVVFLHNLTHNMLLFLDSLHCWTVRCLKK